MVSLALIVAAKGACRSAPFLRMLATSEALTCPGIEIHVVQDSSSSLDVLFPAEVKCHRLYSQVSIFHLWGYGITRATAEYVAVLDIHCPPEPSWFREVAKCLEDEPEALFGPVEPGYDATDPRIVGYLVEYVQFHRPIDPDMTEVAGNNLILRRQCAGDQISLAAHGFIKTHAIKHLRNRPYRIPDAVVTYQKPFSMLGYCLRRYRHGRCFAAHRVIIFRGSLRLLATLFTPVLPILRVWRIFRHTRGRRVYRRAFWRFLPQIAASEIAWSIGECLGYLVGEAACRDYLD